MRVRLSRRAEMDLAEITDFIALDSPGRASQFEDELLERARKISQVPRGYVERPELKQGLRSCAHGAYVIFFTIDENGIRIERILHSARDLGPLLKR
ncbi:MAG: type II toxin-antitoxin system RelE/ParE family toxin [Gammaproteobacteria bacterium]